MPENKKDNNTNDDDLKALMKKAVEIFNNGDVEDTLKIIREITNKYLTPETREILDNIPFILERLKRAYSLASNPNTPEETLVNIFKLLNFYNKRINEDDKYKILIPEEEFKELNFYITKIKEALERNPNTPEDVLKEIIFINIKDSKRFLE